jgi:hypothetical protein
METSNIFIHGIDYHTLYFLPVEDVLNMCTLSSQFATICNDESYWQVKFQYDFPEYFNAALSEVPTYKQAYLELARGSLKLFPVYDQGNIIFSLWMRKTNTEREALSKIYQLFDRLYKVTERQNHPVFVHVLLNTPQRNDPNNMVAKYLPSLREKDVTLNVATPEYGINLWDHIVGFEIIDGEITVQDEIMRFILTFPEHQPIAIQYRYNDIF